MTEDNKPQGVVLITGASSGIGKEFARLYAKRGFDLLLVARREERLQAICQRLQEYYGIKADYIASDLSEPASPQQLYDEVQRRGYTVGTLINNAGFGLAGGFASSELEQAMQMVQVNVDTLIELTALYLPGMVQRGSGDLINVASTAAFQPVANLALYAGTKALVLNFSMAVWAEVKESGVRVLALCPGATATAWADVAGMPTQAANRAVSPKQVVRGALKALARNKGYVVIASPEQRLLKWAATIAPRRLIAQLTKRMIPTEGA